MAKIAKQRGSPDRRGMGAQSDFISEQFVPSAEHREQQLARAQTLIALGIASERVASMLSLPLSALDEAVCHPLEAKVPQSIIS
jgi:hypothetical protein